MMMRAIRVGGTVTVVLVALSVALSFLGSNEGDGVTELDALSPSGAEQMAFVGWVLVVFVVVTTITALVIKSRDRARPDDVG